MCIFATRLMTLLPLFLLCIALTFIAKSIFLVTPLSIIGLLAVTIKYMLQGA